MPDTEKDSTFVQGTYRQPQMGYEELAIPVVDDWLQVVLVVSVDSKGSEDVWKKAIFVGKLEQVFKVI